MKYRLYIFDLDGTILDTLEDLTASTDYALKSCGFPERTLDEVRRFVGNGIRKLIERAVPAETDPDGIDRVHAAFTAHYSEHSADRTRPYEGICETIRILRDAGAKTAVVSNKADYAVQKLIRDYFPGSFDFAVGEKENVRRKPSPDSVNEVLRVLNVPREDAVYIGDSEVDIETAANAGLPHIIVTWGFREKAFLKERGAEVFAERPEDILRISGIENITRKKESDTRNV